MVTVAAFRWDLWLLVAGVACIGVVASSNAGGRIESDLRQTDGQGRLEVTPHDVDFYRDDKKEKKFVELVLRNTGARTVNLLEISASCGCTVPKIMESRKVEPDESVVLKIEVLPPLYGHSNSMVTIRTDAKETPTIQIPVHLHGQKVTPPYMSYVPPDIRINSISDGRPSTVTFQVTCVEAPGEPWLTGFQTDTASASAQPPKIFREEVLDDMALQREYRSEIEIKAIESDLTFWLTPITRTEPIKPLSRIPVTVLQVAAIRAAPSSVVLSFSDIQPETISRNVVLIPADNEEWDIISGETTAVWLKVETLKPETASRNRRLKITASGPPFDESLLHKVDLRIQTSHSKCPSVVIHVTVIRTQKPGFSR